MPTLFFSYSHSDEGLRDQLEKQLTMLKRQGVIETWHDRRITAGETLDPAINTHVENDDIILLLVSPDFLASEYCYSIEMMRAMERQAGGQAVVIPVILRPCEWEQAPFGKLLATPPDGKPVTQWADRDVAFLEVTKAVRVAANKLSSKMSGSPVKVEMAVPIGAPQPEAPGPRSSNLRLAKEFSERDRDRFKLESFEYMARFFENSLHELEQRNVGIETAFRRVDANRFTAAIYKEGKAVARCTIFTGGDRYFGSGINFVHGETGSSNSYNESLRAEADDQAMFLSGSGMRALGRGRGEESKLSQEGGAELYWEMLIQPLQQTMRS